MVAAQSNQGCSRMDNLACPIGDCFHCVLNGRWDDRDVTIIYYFQLFQRCNIESRVMSPDHQRRFTDLSWTKTSPCAVGCAAVEWHTQDGNIDVIQFT